MVSCLASAMLVSAMFPDPNSRQEEAMLRLLSRCSTPTQLKQAHAHILRRGLGRNPALLTSLLRHYTSHRHARAASFVFSQFQTTPPTFAWNLMIRAHTLSGAPLDALLLVYNRMILLGVPPDKFTFPFAIKACSSCSNLEKGKEIHGFSIKTRFYKDVFLQNTLMHLYFNCGDSTYGRQMFDTMRVRNVVSWTTFVSGLVSLGEMQAARAVFEKMPVRNVVSWTVMIDGYARNGLPEEAFKLFQRMWMENVMPNEFTLVGLLIACTELGSLELGRWVHDFAHRNGGLERDVFVGTALIDMYSNCGSLEDALRVFEQMPMKSLATWNSMITSLGVHGHGRDAVSLFEEMEKEATVRLDEITFAGVLCACLRDGLIDEGFRFLTYMIEHYDIVPNVEHWNCLIELLNHKEAKHDVRHIMGLRISKNPVGWQKLIRASKMHGDVELEKLMSERIGMLVPWKDDDDLVFIEHQEQCKWDVG